ncbi:MAG: MoaD/ThiS family protein [Deltaproteobacteria bacterium]|nr:MoaD/ThiS family protein [Deltaproteobacteria bacterium]
MKITLRTFADFRETIGSREVELSLPEGASVSRLLQSLCDSHPALKGKIFDGAGNLKPYILILRNGHNIASLEQLDTLLCDRDIVALFPPVAGG